jgi:hypothetical protein
MLRFASGIDPQTGAGNVSSRGIFQPERKKGVTVSVKYVEIRIVETLMTCHKSPAKHRGKHLGIFNS